jgi:hypothetical protein
MASRMAGATGAVLSLAKFMPTPWYDFGIPLHITFGESGTPTYPPPFRGRKCKRRARNSNFDQQSCVLPPSPFQSEKDQAAWNCNLEQQSHALLPPPERGRIEVGVAGRSNQAGGKAVVEPYHPSASPGARLDFSPHNPGDAHADRCAWARPMIHSASGISRKSEPEPVWAALFVPLPGGALVLAAGICDVPYRTALLSQLVIGNARAPADEGEMRDGQPSGAWARRTARQATTSRRAARWLPPGWAGRPAHGLASLATGQTEIGTGEFECAKNLDARRSRFWRGARVRQ